MKLKRHKQEQGAPKRRRFWRKKKEPEKSLEQAIQNIPRITNETVAEHREEVLSSARKYIYPLQHSLHRIVIISTGLFIAGLVAFFIFCALALYKFQTTSGFVYAVTQVVPFPVAKTGSHFISYESYLFELRHYIHYYQTQQKVDFNSTEGKQQLADFRRRAMQAVISDAYVKQLAKQHNIKVSEQELNNQITLLRNLNRLGSNDQIFEDVLKEFWDWSVSDFKRELKAQMLAQKVVIELDQDTQNRAQDVLAQIRRGGDFTAIAKQSSDDLGTRENGGDYGFLITKSGRDIPPQIVDALFKMNINEVSGVINAGNGLEILKVVGIEGDKVHAQHILFNLKSINTYIDPLRAKDKLRYFVSI